jgi:predicted Rossmann fold nucleotide-binding protein DprA/Smf involved in DNA uptake
MVTTHDDILGRLETVARWIGETRAMNAAALLERKELIDEARRAKISVVRIAYALGVTRKTVHAVIKGR